MSCAFSFLGCLKFRRGAQPHAAAPLLAAADVEDPANPIVTTVDGGEGSGEGGGKEISDLEQQQREELLTRTDGTEPGAAPQGGMPEHHATAPLLPANAVENPENPIVTTVDGGGEDVSDLEQQQVDGSSKGSSSSSNSQEASDLEQQQKAALLTRTDGADSGAASQGGMPKPSAPPAPEVPVNPTSQVVQEALEGTVDAGASEESQGADLAARESIGGAGGSLRDSQLPPAPLTRVDGFDGRGGAEAAGVIAPPGTRAGTPIFRVRQQSGGIGAEQAEATA